MKKIASKKVTGKMAKKILAEMAVPKIHIENLPLRIFSLSQEEIERALAEKAKSPEMQDSPMNPYNSLLTNSVTAKSGIIPYILAEQGRMETTWAAGGFLEFGFDELTTKQNWSWRLKLSIHKELKKVHHEYDIRLVLCPKKHWRQIKDLEDEINDIKAKPQTTLLPDEENEDIKSRLNRIQERKTAWAERQAVCPDVVFDGIVRDVSYKDVKIENFDGEKITIPGTVLTIKIPGSTVEELNALRGSLDDYHIRLQPV